MALCVLALTLTSAARVAGQPRPNATAEQAAAERRVELRDQRMLKKYVWSTLGPAGLLQAGLLAAADQWRRDPSGWSSDATGYVARFSSDYASSAIGGTTKYAIAHLSRQDPSFERCSCRGVRRRLEHALVSPFTARAADGRRVFSVATLGGLAAENVVPAATWYPPPFGVRDGLYRTSFAVLAKMTVDVVHEFMPRKLLHESAPPKR